MKLIKGKPLIKPTYSDVYKFDLSFMIGDSDGYENRVFYVSPSNPYIERFFKFLKNCNTRYIKKVEDYDLFCGGGDKDKDLVQLVFDWPREPYNGELTSFDDYTITYFDVDSIEYEVTVEV